MRAFSNCRLHVLLFKMKIKSGKELSFMGSMVEQRPMNQEITVDSWSGHMPKFQTGSPVWNQEASNQ